MSTVLGGFSSLGCLLDRGLLCMMLQGRCMRGLFSTLSPDRLVDISEVHGGTLGRRSLGRT